MPSCRLCRAAALVAGTVNALAACRGRPTLLLRQEDFDASHNATAQRLSDFFASSGVAPVHSVTPQEYQAAIAAHVKPPREEVLAPKPRVLLSASQVWSNEPVVAAQLHLAQTLLWPLARAHATHPATAPSRTASQAVMRQHRRHLHLHAGAITAAISRPTVDMYAEGTLVCPGSNR